MSPDPSVRPAAERGLHRVDPAPRDRHRTTRRRPRSIVAIARRVALPVALLLLSMATAPLARADEARGSFGFVLAIDGEGFFLDPTLKSVTITSVVPSSPAARAGIAPQDRVVEADGRRVEGTKARELEPLMKKRVGESLRLRLRRPGGDEYDATLVAVSRSP